MNARPVGQEALEHRLRPAANLGVVAGARRDHEPARADGVQHQIGDLGRLSPARRDLGQGVLDERVVLAPMPSASASGRLRPDSLMRVFTAPGTSTEAPIDDPAAARSWASDSVRPSAANLLVT